MSLETGFIGWFYLIASKSTEQPKSLAKVKAGSGLWMEQVPVPETGANDVLIKIIKTSICGTDFHI